MALDTQDSLSRLKLVTVTVTISVTQRTLRRTDGCSENRYIARVNAIPTV